MGVVVLAGSVPLNESGGLRRRWLELGCNLLAHCMVSYKFQANAVFHAGRPTTVEYRD